MRTSASILSCLALVFLASTSAGDVDVTIRFSSNEVSVIRDYYRAYYASHRGGKKGRKSLPPGIAKNLARGKPLPPGIAKQALPDALIAQLPPVPKGYERIIVAGKILLVEIATQVVHDMLVDVILN